MRLGVILKTKQVGIPVCFVFNNLVLSKLNFRKNLSEKALNCDAHQCFDIGSILCSELFVKS